MCRRLPCRTEALATRSRKVCWLCSRGNVLLKSFSFCLLGRWKTAVCVPELEEFSSRQRLCCHDGDHTSRFIPEWVGRCASQCEHVLIRLAVKMLWRPTVNYLSIVHSATCCVCNMYECVLHWTDRQVVHFYDDSLHSFCAQAHSLWSWCNFLFEMFSEKIVLLKIECFIPQQFSDLFTNISASEVNMMGSRRWSSLAVWIMAHSNQFKRSDP